MIEKLLDMVFPRRCAFCNGQAAGELVCVRCDELLPRVGNSCYRCAVPLPASASSDSICGACQLAPPPFARARTAFEYSFPVNSALKSLKYNHRLHYVPVFSAALLTVVRREFPESEALVPVPLHRWRYARRGFNQAYELCKSLSRATGLPVLRNVRRTRATASQSGLTAVQRRRNLAHAFTVYGSLRHERLLIVDDVMTTGETCRQLARTLLAAGASEVDVVAVARA